MSSERPFKRPRKIDNSSKTREIVLNVSEDEWELWRSYAEGRSIQNIAKARGLRVRDISKALRSALTPTVIKIDSKR